MKFRIALAVILSGCVLSLGADQVRGVFAVVLYQHAYTQPVGSGAASANISINCGGASFSQCGWENEHNGTLTSGWFDNLQAGNISPSFPGSQNFYALFDNVDSGGVDRIEAVLGTDMPLFLQAGDGFVGLGPYRAAVQMLTVGGSIVAFDPTQLASNTLTAAGADFGCTNDCMITGNSATWTFSSGLASTLTQTTGNLAIPGQANRPYKMSYTVSGVTGAPSASITTSFANIGVANPTNLNLVNGTWPLYFMTNGAPTNFVITSTLTTGQAFTIALNTIDLQEVVSGNDYLGGKLFLGNCNSGASPAVCGSYTSGVVAIPAGAGSTLVVDTTMVSANSRIILTPDSTEAPSGATCNTAALTSPPRVSARSGATSFTITYDGTTVTNPLCVNFLILD